MQVIIRENETKKLIFGILGVIRCNSIQGIENVIKSRLLVFNIESNSECLSN